MADADRLHQDVPVGFRFRPTDQELVGHYLCHKLLPGGDLSIHNTIPEIQVCKYDPWDLPEFSLIKSDDPEWFFFSRRELKYSNSNRSKRATSHGYWKATGQDRNIIDRDTNNVIGTKKTLVFYQGRIPGVKTNWVIHEYHDAQFPPNDRTHVLCKLLKKPEKKTKEKADKLVYDISKPDNGMVAAEYENQASLCWTPLEVQYYSSDMDSLIQTAVELNGDIVGSTIQTSPSEANSTVDTPQEESEEFDNFIDSVLLLPPIIDYGFLEFLESDRL